MSNRKKYLLVMTLLVFVLVFVSACESKQVVEETVGVFEPAFSEESMLETIKALSSVDNARIAGFEGEFEAANYISEQFTAMGLEVRTQQFPVKAYVSNYVELKVSSESDRVIKEAKTLSFSSATPKGGIATEIVPLGLGAERDYEGIDVTGKIVLIQRGGEFFYVKTERAAQYGALAVRDLKDKDLKMRYKRAKQYR
jgi:aminopeptidase YwaD